MSKFAALTAGLLARKGEAEPCATSFADELLDRIETEHSLGEQMVRAPRAAANKYASINGMGVAQRLIEGLSESSRVIARDLGLAEAPSPEAFRTRDLAGLERECGTCSSVEADDPSKIFHVNLRLKRGRYVRLKLAAALMRRSAQGILCEALDQWLDKLPADVKSDCACLRERGD